MLYHEHQHKQHTDGEYCQMHMEDCSAWCGRGVRWSAVHRIHKTQEEIWKHHRAEMRQFRGKFIERSRLGEKLLILVSSCERVVQLKQRPVSAIGHTGQWLKQPECQQQHNDNG